MHSYNLKDVRIYLSEGKIPENLTRKQKKSFWKFSKGFHIKEDNLFKGNRKVLLSEEDKDRVFRECHASERGAHMGRSKTLDKISRVYYFLNMTEYVYGKIKTCDACQRTERIKTVVESMTPIHSSGPWDILGMDLIGPLPETRNGHRYVVTITDLFTKWVEAYPVRHKSASEIADCILKLFYKFGPPKRVITDQGREFVNSLNEQIFDMVETKHIITSAYHPQSNGQDERTNRTLKTAISKLVNEQQNDWDNLLEPILFGIRMSKHSSTNVTPYLAMFGRQARLFCEIDGEEMQEEIPEATELSTQQQTEKMQKLHLEISKSIKNAQEKQKKDYKKRKNKNHKTFTFKTGQKVLKKNNRKCDRKGQQLETEWTGPYEIAELYHFSALLKTNRGQVLKTKTSLVHLKPYLTDSKPGEKNTYETDDKIEDKTQDNITATEELNNYSNDSVTCQQVKTQISDHIQEKSMNLLTNNDVTTGVTERINKKPAIETVSQKEVNIQVTKEVIEKSAKESPNYNEVTKDITENIENENAPTKQVKSKKHKNVSDAFKPMQTMKSSQSRKRKRKSKILVQNIREEKRRDNTKEKSKDQLELYIVEGTQVLEEMVSNVRKKKQKTRTLRNFNCDYDEKILNSKEWLSDREIDFAQKLLAERHTSIESLQSVLLLKAAEYGGFILSVSCGKFVQIINVSGNHWITFTGNANDHHVDIYDSMGCHLTEELIFIIAAILHTNAEKLNVRFIDCIQQVGIEDCGLFAIANATALCLGEEPSSYVWKQSQMREHLLKEFRRGEIGLFPYSRRSRAGKVKREEKVMLCTCCRMPTNSCVMKV